MMKISMHLIKRCLGGYSPMSIISEGDPILEGVRMFSATTPPSPQFVYVARNSDFFGSNNNNSVILANRNDVIHVASEDIEDIFNQVEATFDYYRQLEFNLELAIHLPDAEQRIVDICRDLFGPTYIMNQKYHILAISSSEEPGDYYSLWKELERSRLLPIEDLGKRSDVAFYQNINKKVHNLVFENNLTRPYNRAVMNSYCSREGKLIGQLMIAFDREIHTEDLQLMDVIVQYLHRIDTPSPPDNGSYLSEMILDALVQQRPYQADDIVKVRELQHWNADTAFCLFVCTMYDHDVQLTMEDLKYLTNVQQNIYRKRPGSIAVISGNYLVCCLKTTEADYADTYTPAFIEKLTRNSRIRIGVSYRYRDFLQTGCYYQQAVRALEYAFRKNMSHSSFFCCALDSCLLSTDPEFRLRSLHPAVFYLQEFDRTRGTEYLITLQNYLQAERKYVDAAREMHVHRNTIVYRIEKIGEMWPMMDLEHSEERMYLQYSLRVLQMT